MCWNRSAPTPESRSRPWRRSGHRGSETRSRPSGKTCSATSCRRRCRRLLTSGRRSTTCSPGSQIGSASWPSPAPSSATLTQRGRRRAPSPPGDTRFRSSCSGTPARIDSRSTSTTGPKRSAGTAARRALFPAADSGRQPRPIRGQRLRSAQELPRRPDRGHPADRGYVQTQVPRRVLASGRS
jgi:hypothetical protein